MVFQRIVNGFSWTIVNVNIDSLLNYKMKKEISNEIMVSVCVVTYNHSLYIKECLDSILGQKTTFKYELLINDDCSTDGTVDILRSYETKYPGIVIPVFHDKNMYDRGIKDNFSYYNHILFPMAKGKYIACCDGDDYWTDKCKLQKQFDIMEKNPNYSLCYHNYSILRDGEIVLRTIERPTIQNLEEAASNFSVQTTSMFFRNPHECLIPTGFAFKYRVYQFFWALRLAEFGYIYYIDEAMSVARVHAGGVFSGSDSKRRFQMSIGNLQNLIDWYSKGNVQPKVVRALKKRARCVAIPYIVSSVKHLRLKDLIEMLSMVIKL